MNKLKVIVPMAGLGSRFSSQGYTDPKPLIQFLGKPMVQHVVEHLGLLELEHIFLCQKDHIEKYKLHELFSTFVKNYKIVEVDGLTEGAACTVMLADSLMSPDDEFFIVNSDQLLYWDKYPSWSCEQIDGCIYIFKGTGPKWSYAKVNHEGYITEVAEKKEISNLATCGLYYWKRWSDFMAAGQAMIAADDRVNNEFYVAPVYNYAIKAGKHFVVEYIGDVDQVGTPEELNEYLQKHDA